MENNASVPSGTTPNASGNPEPKPEPIVEDKVAYETHRKLLGEKKKQGELLGEATSKLAEFEQREKDREESDLKAKEDWKKLVELRTKERDDAVAGKSDLESTLAKGLKKDAFVKALKGGLEPQYERLIDYDKIIIDPQTGLPDEASVGDYARSFESDFGRVLVQSTGPRLPNGAPIPNGNIMSLEEWHAIKDPKRKREHYEEVFNAHKDKV